MTNLDKKTLFLQSAWQYFNQYGFHAATVDQISQSLGITKRTLYRYFPTKELLIQAVLEYRDQQFLAQLTHHLHGYTAHSAAIAYIEYLENWVQQPDFFGCSFINASAEFSDMTSLPHHIAQQHKKAVYQQLQQVMPTALATTTLLIGEGLIVNSQVNGYNVEYFEHAKRLIEQQSH